MIFFDLWTRFWSSFVALILQDLKSCSRLSTIDPWVPIFADQLTRFEIFKGSHVELPDVGAEKKQFSDRPKPLLWLGIHLTKHNVCENSLQKSYLSSGVKRDRMSSAEFSENKIESLELDAV